MMDSFRNRLKHWMKIRGIKAKTLSKKAGLHETYVRDALKRTEAPNLVNIAKLCKALDIYPHDLVPEIREIYPPDAVELLEELSQIRERKREINKSIAALRE